MRNVLLSLILSFCGLAFAQPHLQMNADPVKQGCERQKTEEDVTRCYRTVNNWLYFLEVQDFYLGEVDPALQLSDEMKLWFHRGIISPKAVFNEYCERDQRCVYRLMVEEASAVNTRWAHYRRHPEKYLEDIKISWQKKAVIPFHSNSAFMKKMFGAMPN
jgi:hypothetical protein